MSSQKTLLTLIAGACLGAVAGLLLAPASGKDTRNNLLKKADGLRDQLSDLIDQRASKKKNARGAGKNAHSKVSKAKYHTMDGDSGQHEFASGSRNKA